MPSDPQQPLVKVAAYSVVVVMGDPASAMVAHNVVLASSPEHAVAIVMGLSAMEGQAKMPIGNVGVIPLPEPMLRAALNGGQPGAVVPLSVVPSGPLTQPEPAQPPPSRVGAWQASEEAQRGLQNPATELSQQDLGTAHLTQMQSPPDGAA